VTKSVLNLKHFVVNIFKTQLIMHIHERNFVVINQNLSCVMIIM